MPLAQILAGGVCAYYGVNVLQKKIHADSEKQQKELKER
jgi:hypothetical protein